MKLYNITDLDSFFKTIDRCIGTVELVSKEGDRINLKSKLSQFVAMANVFNNNELIEELELVAHKPEDVRILMEYMTNEGGR